MSQIRNLKQKLGIFWTKWEWKYNNVSVGCITQENL